MEINLLLIEDDGNVASLLAQAFDLEGHRTTIAYTGEEGLRYLQRERPDAVFLDVQLPTINGIEVLRIIRSTDTTLPVVLITGHASPGQLAEAQTLGISEIIEKPDVLKHFSGALLRIAMNARQN